MKFNFGNIKKVASISVYLNGDGLRFDALILKFVKGEIEIQEEYNDLNTIEELTSKIGVQLPYVLNFNGKGVLNRKVDNSENKYQSILLNSNATDFYFTEYGLENNYYISVVRRSVVKQVVADIEAFKGCVINVSSGPFLLAGISQYIGKPSYTLHDYVLTFEKDKLIGFKKEVGNEKQWYLVGKQNIRGESLSALSNGVQFFNSAPEFILPNDPPIFEKNYEEAKQKVIFKQFGFFMLVFFLVLLLGNYLYLGHLNKTVQSNAFLLAEYTEDFAKINELEEEKTRKEILLRTSGVLTKKYISFYLVEIAKSVPKEVVFNQLTVKPVKKEIKDKHKIEIDNQLILVNGISKSSSHLSDWISDLKKIDWINKVEIVDYEYAGGNGEFAIRIVI